MFSLSLTVPVNYSVSMKRCAGIDSKSYELESGLSNAAVFLHVITSFFV
jgi:hypothetical protein